MVYSASHIIQPVGNMICAKIPRFRFASLGMTGAPIVNSALPCHSERSNEVAKSKNLGTNRLLSSYKVRRFLDSPFDYAQGSLGMTGTAIVNCQFHKVVSGQG